MFDIDPRSALPVYEQIKRQIRILIASGRLTDGARLPSIRELAQDLRVNPNTVAKAYGQLEFDGFLSSRAGSGFFVTMDQSRRDSERTDLLESLTDDFLARASVLGFSDHELIDSLRRRLEGGGLD